MHNTETVATERKRLTDRLRAARAVPSPLQRMIERQSADPDFADRLWARIGGGDVPIDDSGEDAEPVEQVEQIKPTAELLTLDQAAAYLNVTADQVTAFVQDGELQYINVGRGKRKPRIRITKQDLDEFIEQRRRREIRCRSTSTQGRHSTTTQSKSVVVGFTALQNARRAVKLKPSKP